MDKIDTKDKGAGSKGGNFFVWVLIVMAVLMFSLGALGLYTKYVDGGQDNRKISTAKQMVSDALKDGESARFYDLRMGTAFSVCGQVNAKNSYGAYTGKSPFVVLTGNLVMIRNSTPLDYFDATWDRICQ